ncbi:MAG: Na/Pi symporter [Candidatus Sedimenticola endophacoides]
MYKKILLPSIFLVLAYGFWISPDFKEISAGVAIFLFGMLSLEQGFRAFAGGTLEKILRSGTSGLWRSLSFGIVSTTLMQSSSLVSVIAISFLSAGLITLASGIGIIFGANLGTTTGAWLIAGLGLKVDIAAYAMPMLVFGIILVFQQSKRFKGIGYILAGLGFLFLGIHHMKEGFDAFKATIDLSRFAVAGYPGLFLFTGIGVFATVVMQSSHATLVLIITALSVGQISYENALALAIGTTITAILGAMSANAEGKRLAGAHLIFNLTTGLIAIVFIHQFLELVELASQRIGIRTDDYTLKLALFHTLFNLAGVIVMVPLIRPMERLLKLLIKTAKRQIDKPKYLTGAAVDFPDTAVRAVRLETLHVYENALSIIIHALGFKRHVVFSSEILREIPHAQHKITRLNIDAAYERSIKWIYSAIIEFISRANFTWQVEQSGELHHLRQANLYIVEAIKDVKHLQKNLLHYMEGSSDAMREAYHRLRIELISVVRELEEIRASGDHDTKLLSLDALRLVVKDSKDETNLWITELIRSERITPTMGTSLMNDSAYLFDICKNLVKAAQALFVGGEREMTQAARSVSLEETELHQLTAENQASPTQARP